MTSVLRSGVVACKPETELQGEVEFDEMYVVAGYKGYPEAVKKSEAQAKKKEDLKVLPEEEQWLQKNHQCSV